MKPLKGDDQGRGEGLGPHFPFIFVHYASPTRLIREINPIARASRIGTKLYRIKIFRKFLGCALPPNHPNLTRYIK
ncbi:hypothetical protein J2129_002070 [Methanofollis sp. W23]|nr:hypothetical protein [Methanofollis sp. W23]